MQQTDDERTPAQAASAPLVPMKQPEGSPRFRAACAVCALVVALAASAVAQTPVDFRSKDGTRFLLLSQPGAPMVHWAVATPIGPRVDPIGQPGLSEAVFRASIRGGFGVGSLDVDAEKKALDEIDALEAELAGPVKSAEETKAKAARIEELRVTADKLSDPAALRRVLAGAPATNVRLRTHGDVATLSLTTTPLGAPAIAKLLFERREQQALRGHATELAAIRRREAAAREQDPLAPLYAEALALAFAGHPLARAGDQPSGEPVRRAEALAAWARSQNPQNTVHALFGSFDVASMRMHLERTFAATGLPDTAAAAPAEARAPNAIRRAMVPGARRPAALIAFAMPGDANRHAIETVARWFADGPESWMARELARGGRTGATVAVRASWPQAANPGLLVIEATDVAGASPTLADDVLKILARSQNAAPEPGRLPLRFAAIQRDFMLRTDSSNDLAEAMAAFSVENPSAAPLAPPATPVFGELAQQLRAILATSPIVVEWRDA